MKKPSPVMFPLQNKTNTLVYLGTSMHPTLQNLDVLHYVPYGDRDPKKGDIVVIQRVGEPDKKIIHRIVRINPQGIATMGDNNSERDPWILLPEEILGYVTRANRGERAIIIYSGFFGCLEIFKIRSFRKIRSSLNKVMKYPYQWLVASNIFIPLLTPLLTYRMVEFSGSERSEVHMYLGPFSIGRYKNLTGEWEIRPPFRLFVSPSNLKSPGMGDGSTSSLQGGGELAIKKNN